MEDQLMAVCSLSSESSVAEAIVVTIERNAANFAKIVDAVCEKWKRLAPASVVVSYSVPDQSMRTCLVTLTNDADVANMYDLHKALKAPVVKMSAMAVGAEPRKREDSRRARLDVNCENCKKHAEHLYWDHTEVNGMSFFKAMTGDFFQQMELPKKFVNQFRGELSEKTLLKGPSGYARPVALTKTGTGTFLQSGWKEFVEAHNIEAKDILFFTYDGNSCFNIVICDESCCEKTTSYYANNRGSLKRKRSADPLKNQNGRSQRRVVECISSSISLDDSLQDVPSSTPHSSSKENEEAGSEDKRIGSSSRRKLGRSTRFSTYLKSRRGKKRTIRGSKYQVQQESLEKHSSKTLKLGNQNIYISKRLPLTYEERKRALPLVDAVQSDNPCFLTVMRLTMLHRANFMTVPAGFKAAYLPSRACNVFLQVPSRQKTWTVNFVMKGPRMGFCGGWRDFHLHNNLQVGDICLFELVSKHENIVMTVHIDRARIIKEEASV
ncbi:putative pentatricopeptide repeat-containing proteinisoform X1 [Iris pallida]|uniref:Pentatricopeptide repeat-containing proteinisoform X1 n=1 Tax=Iris pallida TaxID=29817 RepID=A0AAX6FKL7_IRIPA|nr:putative pentatricopeptide repeat-containing proteinisoform X1 [Iris pallida]